MSDKTKHTPGPWLYREKNCAVYTASSTHPYGQFIFGFDQDNPPEDADANLVIAAPELLDALRIAREFMSIASDWNFHEAEINGEMRSTYEWLGVVDAAIAKATGETA